MHLSYLSLLLTATATVSGFTIPARQAEGVYQVIEQDNSTYEHTKIAEVSIRPLEKRLFETLGLITDPFRKEPGRDEAVKVKCGLGKDLNPADVKGAIADLANQCGYGTTVKSRKHFYAIRGETVAFACNFAMFWDRPQKCLRDKVMESAALIKDHCGEDHSGWADWNAARFSYGVDSTSINFCGTGTNLDNEANGQPVFKTVPA